MTYPENAVDLAFRMTAPYAVQRVHAPRASLAVARLTLPIWEAQAMCKPDCRPRDAVGSLEEIVHLRQEADDAWEASCAAFKRFANMPSMARTEGDRVARDAASERSGEVADRVRAVVKSLVLVHKARARAAGDEIFDLASAGRSTANYDATGLTMADRQSLFPVAAAAWAVAKAVECDVLEAVRYAVKAGVPQSHLCEVLRASVR